VKNLFSKEMPDLKIFKEETQNEILGLVRGREDDSLLLILQWEDNVTRNQKNNIIQRMFENIVLFFFCTASSDFIFLD
jgi:hypothetical protein